MSSGDAFGDGVAQRAVGRPLQAVQQPSGDARQADEAKAAVAATRYPPHGVRGVAGTSRANNFGRTKDYYARVEQETAVLIQLESVAAVTNAVEIGTVDGVTGVFFGPADIGADMGLLGDTMNPAIWDLIRPAAQALIAAGVPVGTLVTDTDFAQQLLNEGFSFVACGIDVGLLAKSADAITAQLPAQTVHQFLPLDAPQYVARFLDHWRPDLLIWTEQDLWPTFAVSCANRNISQAIVAGRMNAASFERHKRIQSLYRNLYQRMVLISAQDTVSQQNLRNLGGSNVALHGSVGVVVMIIQPCFADG